MKRHSGVVRRAFGVWTLVGVSLLSLSSQAVAQDECVGFDERVEDDGRTNGAIAVYPEDINGDGDIDLVVASYNDDTISWFENSGGESPTFERHVIASEADGAVAVYAADLDNDGDVDVLSASSLDNKIAWYENIGSTPPVFFEHRITSGADHATAVVAVDIDGDADLDVLTAAYVDGTIVWYENLLGGTTQKATFTPHVIATQAWGVGSVWAADVDGDGDTDVISQSVADQNKLTWYEAEPSTETNDDGEQVPVLVFTKHVVAASADNVRWVFAANLDGDADIELLSASPQDDTLAWYDGAWVDADSDGTMELEFTQHVIAADAVGAKSVHAADVDGDGDFDVLAAAERGDEFLWYENDGGQTPSFVGRVIPSIAESPDSIWVADVNGDGDVDVAAAASVPGPISSNDKVLWFESDGADPPALAERVVATESEGARSIVSHDMDGDGDLDLVWAGGFSKVAWSEYDGGNPPVFTERVISNDAPGSSEVFVIDLDSDGDPDVLAASADDDKIAWHDNDGATPPGFTERVISTNADGAQSVHAADLDNDGDLDVISASSNDGKVAWYEYDDADSDGTPDEPWVEHVLAAEDEELSNFEAPDARSVWAADLDNDGDMDVLSASAGNDLIAWYRNDEDPDDPPARIFQQRGISFEAVRPQSVHAADLDADGDIDVMSAAAGSEEVAWYENTENPDDETVPLFVAHLIAGVGSGAARHVSTADVDGDGDLDIVSAASGTDRVRWFENDTETLPGLPGHLVGSSAANPTTVAVGDFTADGRPDIVAGYAFQIVWYERVGELCVAFDVNGDDQMDGIELIYLARAFGRNVGGGWWDPLDYNNDGIVDGTDLAILASTGVWGMSVDTCSYTCQ